MKYLFLNQLSREQVILIKDKYMLWNDCYEICQYD